MFKLTIEDDEGKTTVVPLARDEMTIGRLEGNTIRLTERNVSRKHARLVRQNGALFIEDLSSFTGVRVNGAKIASPTTLREGDEVQIGDYRLALRGDNKSAATPPPMTDRATMPSMPAALGPMATVGGSVAIPTRASVAAMAVQSPQPLAAPPPLAAPTLSPMPFPAPRKSAPQPAQPTDGVAAVPAVAPVPAPAPPPAPSLAGPEPAPVFAPAHTPAPVPTLDAPVPGPADTQTPAPEVSEAQPTIPIRTLGEAVTGSPAARVFALTTELAGMEFGLDRPSLVIGRTDENDIVLNHRSISRHHAKIVRDGEQYTIVDLQSANGVRVNGEDYERIELNPGDVIELGHVKLRFVGPNERFAFDARSTRGAPKLRLKFLAGGAVALVALVVVASIWHRVSRSKSAPVVASVAPAIVTPPPAPPPVVQPPPAPEPPPAAPQTPAEIMVEAKEATGAEDWDKARTALDKLGTTIADPALRKDVIALRRKIDTERQAAVTFAQFDEAASASNHLEAVAKYRDIPLESLYKRRAKPRYEEARASVVSEHLAAAEKARAAGRCAEVKAEADEVIKLDARNMVVREMVRLCRARPEPAPPVAARPARARPSAALVAENRAENRRTDVPVRKPEAAARPEPSRSEASDDAGDPDALMKQAREAWLKQQCGSAIDLSRKALHAKPGMTDAYQIIAVCSCTLKDGEAAGRAYAKLEDKSRNLVRSLCQKNGISLGE